MGLSAAGRIGKRGTLVIPAKLRRIFGFEPVYAEQSVSTTSDTEPPATENR